MTDQAAPTEPAVERRQRKGSISGQIGRIRERLSPDSMTVGELVDAFGRAGIGLMLLILSIPAMIPVPGLPIGSLFGVLLLVICWQLMLGADRLLLPRFIRDRTLPPGLVHTAIDTVLPFIKRHEVHVKPRLVKLAGPSARARIAVPLTIGAILVAAPIPLGNAIPALGMFVISVGYLRRDGYAVLLGTVIVGLGMVWNLLLLFAGASLAAWLFG
jgi:hypothetical protein